MMRSAANGSTKFGSGTRSLLGRAVCFECDDALAFVFDEVVAPGLDEEPALDPAPAFVLDEVSLFLVSDCHCLHAQVACSL